MKIDNTSFLFGFWISFVLTLLITGYIMSYHFVSIDYLMRDKFYLNGRFYKLERVK